MPKPRKTFCLFSYLLACALCCFAQPSDKNVIIRIVQDEHVFTPDENQYSITLQKKTFKIQVLLQNIEGVFAFASLNDSLYSLPGNKPVPGFAYLPVMAMAEEEFNKEKELLLDDQGWAYWFFDPALPWHWFNKKIILLDSGRVVGTKTIKQLYLLPQRQIVKLKDNKGPLYLFFVAVEEADASGRPVRELMRRKIKIEWQDED